MFMGCMCLCARMLNTHFHSGFIESLTADLKDKRELKSLTSTIVIKAAISGSARLPDPAEEVNVAVFTITGC